MADMDKLLRQAFDEIAKEEYENRPEVIPEHKFSLKFRWKMHRILRKMKTGKETREDGKGHSLMGLYRSVHSRKRRMVILLLVIMVLGGTAFATEPVIRWLCNYYVDQYDDHVKIQRDNTEESEDKERGTFRKYYLTEVPEGYSLDMEEFDEEVQRNYVFYVDEKGKVISLKQAWKKDERPENITSDTEPLKDVEVSGFTGYYAKDGENGSLILSNGVYTLVLSGPFSKTELIEIAGKLELVNES